MSSARSVGVRQVACCRLRPLVTPQSWPVLRHARDDASCTTASRELGVPTFGAWLRRRLISAARRLLSSPATRAHLGHSAQTFWSASKNWQTFCAHPVRPRRSETCRNAPCYPLSARSRSSCLLQIRWLDDAQRASSNHACGCDAQWTDGRV